MLLDIGSVLGGIGLAVVGFVVVVLVCVVILRLLAVILPSYEDHAVPAVENDPVPVDEGAQAVSSDDPLSADDRNRAGSASPGHVDPPREPPE